MSLGQHLVELRKRLLIAGAAIVVAMVAGWLLAPWVWGVLRQPLDQLRAEGRVASITYTGVTEGFDTMVQISLFIAILLASPVWLYQIWAFFAPGLRRREKLYAVGFIGTAVPLFLLGVYAAWAILPNIVRVMAVFQEDSGAYMQSARGYLDFTVKLLLAVGVGFVMPVALVGLNFAGVIRGQTILKGWRVGVLLIVLFAAAATPAVDLMSMFLLAIPLTVLFFLAVGISLLHDRRIDRRTAEEFAEYELDVPGEAGARGGAL